MLRRCCFLVLAALAGCGPRSQPVPAPEAQAPSEPAPEITVASAPAATPRSSAEPTPAQAPQQSADPNDCSPFVAPLTRTGGNLTVHAPPRKPQRSVGSRMRTQIEGALSAGSLRVWTGPQVPGFVPLLEGTAELFLLDHQPDGSFLAFYRDPYDASSCALSGHNNCAYVATLFAHCGEVMWSISLTDLLSRPDHLEIQDIRLDGDTLYFNEGCQSYSKDANGKCSALIAVDPRANQVLWRTKPLVSNALFFISGDYIVAGYGFTAERDTLSIVRRSDGRVMQTKRLPKAPQDIRLLEPGMLEVEVYPGDTTYLFRMVGWETGSPKLVKPKDRG